MTATIDSDAIPIVEIYNGVGIHDKQPRERIERVVKPEIDAVFANERDAPWLLRHVADMTKAPESRLLARALLEATFEGAANERRARPDINIDYVRACTAGLGSKRLRSRTEYRAIFSLSPAPGTPGPVKREVPLADDE